MTDSNGDVFVCGTEQPSDVGLRVKLRVLKDTFWVRTLLFTDMVRQNSVSMACEACGEGVESVRAESYEKSRALRKVSC